MQSTYQYRDGGHGVYWDLCEAGVSWQALIFAYREDIQEWVIFSMIYDESNDMDHWKTA